MIAPPFDRGAQSGQKRRWGVDDARRAGAILLCIFLAVRVVSAMVTEVRRTFLMTAAQRYQEDARALAAVQRSEAAFVAAETADRRKEGEIAARAAEEERAFQSRFAAVSASVASAHGAAVRSYQPPKDGARREMDVVLPGELSDYQARKVALEVFSALKTDGAMVCIFDDTGQQRAFATREGVHN